MFSHKFLIFGFMNFYCLRYFIFSLFDMCTHTGDAYVKTWDEQVEKFRRDTKREEKMNTDSDIF